MNNRKIVLDTETTGINKYGLHYLNHKIIEIGAIEIIDNKITGRKFHKYINPNRKIDLDAFNIHKISNNFLINKPFFYQICNEFIDFIINSELIIHNAKFDIDFINYELSFTNNKIKDITKICSVIDSLKIARKKFPRKRNSLDALCERYKIKKNTIHGALFDSEALAKVFLLLIREQTEINFEYNKYNNYIKLKNNLIEKTKIIYANNNEIYNHKKFLQYIKKRYRVNLLDNF